MSIYHAKVLFISNTLLNVHSHILGQVLLVVFPHFTVEYTEAKRSDFFKATELGSGRARI